MKEKAKRPNRFETINYMFDIGFEKYEMTPSERIIYCALWNCADLNGLCTLSLNRLKSMTGLAKSTVQLGINRFIRELKIVRISKNSTRKGVARVLQIKQFPYKRGQKTV